MADMVDCGRETFKAWARQTPSPSDGKCWHDRWLGPFNPAMEADQACQLICQDRITTAGAEAFKRGWAAAQIDYRQAHPDHKDGGA